VASQPVEVAAVAELLLGQPLTDAVIANAAEIAAVPARPMDNTDFPLVWRKRLTREFVSYALREVRGDDVRELRRKVARNPLLAG
jgi:CO/xanthine dehydrogenase FAD-binding subunit